MNTRITVTQLERMTTHELADLLGNIVLLLKRLPDVECKQLEQTFPDTEQIASDEIASKAERQAPPAKKYTSAELNKKVVAEVKEIAASLHLTFTSKTSKKELMSKILAYQEQGHSDQFAIQNL